MASSSTNSADIGIRIFLQDAASSALFAIDTSLGRLGQTARNSGILFGNLSDQMARLAIVAGLALSFFGFGAAIVYSVQQGQELQKALTDIALATGLTTDQMALLQPFLLNLGADSIYSLQQLADGISVVGQYGFKTTQQIEDMASAGVKLAEATGTDTVSAFKLLAVTMQAFGIPASQANDVAALLFYSIEHGTPNVANLTTALGQLGGSARTLHLSLQDIIPALDTVTVGMGSASTASAGLRYFLLNISNDSSTTGKELTNLGLSAFNAQGNFIGLKPVLQEILDKVAGLSDQAKGDIFGKLFNIRSGTAVKQLLQQIQQYEQGITNVNNVTKLKAQLDDAVNKVMGQLGSVIHEVTSNFQDFAALVGTQIIPILTGFLAGPANNLAKWLREQASNPAFAQLVSRFLMIGAGISGVALLFIAAASPIGQFVLIMLTVAAAAVALAAGLTWVQAHWNLVTLALQKAWQAIQPVLAILLVLGATIAGIALAPFIAALGLWTAASLYQAGVLTVQLVPALIKYVGDMAVWAGKVVVWAAQNAGVLVPSLLSSVGAWLANAAAAALAALPYILIAAVIAGAIIGLVLLVQHLGGLNVLLALGRAAWAAILPSLQQAGAAIKGAFLQALQQLQPVWQQLVQAFNQAKPTLMFLGQVLGVLIVVALGILLGVLRGVINVVAALLTAVIGVVAGIIRAFMGVVQFFMGFFTLLQGIFTGNTKLIQQGWNTMGQGILNIVTGLWNAVKAVFVGAFQAIVGFVTGFISGIVGFFQGLANQLVHHSIIPDMLAAIVSAIINFVPTAIAAFTNFVTGLVNKAQQIPNQVKNAMGNLGNFLYSAGQSLIQGFINGLQSMISSLTGTVSNILAGIRNMFPHSPAKEGPLTDAHLWMPNLVHMLADTADQAGPSLKASMSRVAGSAKAGIGTPTGGSGSGGSGGEVYTLSVDGKAFMSFFHNKLTGELQANGLGRILR